MNSTDGYNLTQKSLQSISTVGLACAHEQQSPSRPHDKHGAFRKSHGVFWHAMSNGAGQGGVPFEHVSEKGSQGSAKNAEKSALPQRRALDFPLGVSQNGGPPFGWRSKKDMKS